MLPENVSTMVMCTKPGWDDGFRPQTAYVVADTARVVAITNAFNALPSTPPQPACDTTSGMYRVVLFGSNGPAVALEVSPQCSSVSNTTIERGGIEAADSLAKAAVEVPGTRTVDLYPTVTPTSVS